MRPGDPLPRHPGSLAGRVAIVTGAAGGIGRGLVEHLHDAGATVVAVDIAEHDVPPTDHAKVRDGSPIVEAFCDVSNDAEIQQLVDDVARRYGHVDILVNNAGVFDNVSSVATMDVAAWDRELSVNLSAPFFATRAALPHMVRQRFGRIINISSISSGGAFKQAGYGASKLGLIALTRTVAMEFAPAGITANAVLPGLIGTPKALAAPRDILDDAVRAIPAGRVGTVAEVADVVSFLASASASYVNGAALPVDGGALLLQLRFGPRSSLTPDSVAGDGAGA